MDLQYNFVTPLASVKNTELLNDLKEYIYKQNVKGIESNCAIELKSNLVESKFDLFSKNDPVIQKTKIFVATAIAKLLNRLHSEKSNYQVEFFESWFHVGKTNSVHDTHIHANCSWCGIYYVDAGDDGSGQTFFINPINATYIDDGNRWLQSTGQLKVPAQNGLLVLFPSYLQHYQKIYTGEKDRIVIAFNARIYPKEFKSS
tara:strand:- start:45 stop:650 length:606 start_codon:yes stop_codon:yes gene_type:complete